MVRFGCSVELGPALNLSAIAKAQGPRPKFNVCRRRKRLYFEKVSPGKVLLFFGSWRLVGSWNDLYLGRSANISRDISRFMWGERLSGQPRLFGGINQVEVDINQIEKERVRRNGRRV